MRLEEDCKRFFLINNLYHFPFESTIKIKRKLFSLHIEKESRIGRFIQVIPNRKRYYIHTNLNHYTYEIKICNITFCCGACH